MATDSSMQTSTKKTESTKCTFHASNGENTATDSVRMVQVCESAPPWRKRFENARAAVRVIVIIVFLGLAVIAVAISVPLAMKSKSNSQAATNATPSTSASFYGLNETTPTTRESTTSPDKVARFVSSGWYPVQYSGRVFLYKISSNKANYTDAKAKCVRKGATLAAVGLRIAAVRKKLFSSMVFPNREFLFIGLDDLESKHTWRWVDGVISTRDNTDWEWDEPNGARERCGETDRMRHYKVNDSQCEQRIHYLCEKIV